MESKYLAKFAKLDAGMLALRGDRMLVEKLPKEEFKTAGGLFINSSLSDHKSQIEMQRGELAIVLACGTGYVDEDGKEYEVDARPGTIILCNGFNYEHYSQFPGLAGYTQGSLAMVRERAVIASWPSLEAYNAYKAKLNEEIK